MKILTRMNILGVILLGLLIYLVVNYLDKPTTLSLHYFSQMPNIVELDFPYVRDKQGGLYYLEWENHVLHTYFIGNLSMPIDVTNDSATVIDDDGRVLTVSIFCDQSTGKFNNIKIEPQLTINVTVRDFSIDHTGETKFYIDNHGKLWSNGDVFYYYLQTNTREYVYDSYFEVENLPPLIKMIRGNNHSVVLDENQNIWSWGSTGDELQPFSVTPVKSELISNVVNIYNFNETLYVIDGKGEVWLKGLDYHGLVNFNEAPHFLYLQPGDRFLPYYHEWTKVSLSYKARSISFINNDLIFFNEREDTVVFKPAFLHLLKLEGNYEWYQKLLKGEYGRFIDRNEAMQHTDLEKFAFGPVYEQANIIDYYSNWHMRAAITKQNEMIIGNNSDCIDDFEIVVVESKPVKLSGKLDGFLIVLLENGNLLVVEKDD